MNHRIIAYFSMEIGLLTEMPTYSGGLGVLAGDMVRAGADLNVPMLAITLLHRKGYFYQRLDPQGRQTEDPVQWAAELSHAVVRARCRGYRRPHGDVAGLAV